MKTEDLQAKGLTQEQIDYVMAEYGKDINGIKQERDTYKTQLSTAQATLKSFEGVNISELQGKIQTLTTDLANKDAEYQKQLAERDFNDLLKTTAEGFKPRDLKAVMPFLDVEKLKASKNQETDIKTALEAVKKDNAYLFQDVSIPRVVAPTPGPGGDKTDDTRTQANNSAAFCRLKVFSSRTSFLYIGYKYWSIRLGDSAWNEHSKFSHKCVNQKD